MKILKFAFLILGLVSLISFIGTLALVWDMSFGDKSSTDSGFLARFWQFFQILSSTFSSLTLGLFCFLGAKLAAVLEDRGVYADIRTFSTKLRNAGDKTGV